MLTVTETGQKQRVVIIGAGFAGIQVARGLGAAGMSATLLDRRNYNLFQPLLYQVATAALSPADIAEPVRRMLRRFPSIEVLMGEVTGIDVAARRVALADGKSLSYGILVLAAGATHAYFGHDEWEPLAPGLKTIEDALEIRRRVLLAFELAERHAAARQAARLQTDDQGGDTQGEPLAESPLRFVVVGGGPTGVELAGTLAEIARHSLTNEFRNFDPRQSRIVELRFFAGLSLQEISEVMGIATATVQRDWTAARAWLHREISRRPIPGDP